MDLVIENVLENLQIHLEHDSGYPPDWDVLPDQPEYENYIENARNQILVLNGVDDKPIEGAYYVSCGRGLCLESFTRTAKTIRTSVVYAKRFSLCHHHGWSIG